MNIVYVNHYAGSEIHGIEYRPFFLAREWVKMGHEVTILCASYTHLRKINPTVTKNFTEEIIEGIRYVWVNTPSYKDNSVFRTLNIFSFLKKLKKNAQWLADTYKPHLVIASSTYPMDAYPCRTIADLAGGVMIFEIHDLWPLTQMTFGNLSKKNPVVRYLQKAEDFAFTRSDGIVSILPHADKHIRERNVHNFFFLFVPNGVIIEQDSGENSKIPEPHQTLLRELKAQNRFILMYLGGHTVSNSLETLVESGQWMPSNVSVVFVGEGRYKARLQEACAQKRYKNFHFLPGVPKSCVRALQAEADFLYIGAKKCKLYEYGVGMNKYYDYMLSARPIINGVEASNNLVKEANCGVTIPAEDPKALAEAVAEAAKLSAEERNRLGQNGYAYVTAHHEYRALAEKFLDFEPIKKGM